MILRLSFFRAHGWAIAVLAAGIAIRTMVMIAYPEAFFFPDSRNYTTWALKSYPAALQPYGYSLFLRPFVPGPMAAVAVVQHLMGLGLAVLGYVYLTRRGVAGWLGALAIVPIALDGEQIALEHYVMAETLFLVLVASALVILTLRPRGWAWTAAAGVLLAGAALTRTVGLPLVLLALAYLVVRRTGWRPVAAFAVAAALPLGGYLHWFHERHGEYAFNKYTGRFLYARVQTFADCNRLDLTPKQRTLCVDTPVSAREQRTDLYLWNSEYSPAHRLYRGLEHDPFLLDFALIAIREQPVDFATVVGRETVWHFLPEPPLDRKNQCIAQRWVLPELPGEGCQAILYVSTASTLDTPKAPRATEEPLRTWLAKYSRVVTTHGPLLALCLLLSFAAVVRGRRGDRVLAGDAALFAGTALALIVLSVATSAFDTRYGLAGVWLFPVAAALAANALFTRRRAPVAHETVPTGEETPAPVGAAPPVHHDPGLRLCLPL